MYVKRLYSKYVNKCVYSTTVLTYNNTESENQIANKNVTVTSKRPALFRRNYNVPGVEVTNTIPPIPLFCDFFSIVKAHVSYWISSTGPLSDLRRKEGRQRNQPIEYHVYIWQVSPQLSCGDTCQIWMWFKEYNRYVCKIENFAYGEIKERLL